MTFQELSDAVYEELNGRVTRVSSDEDAYRILFECDDWREKDRRRFELTVEGVVEATVVPSECGSLKAEEDHPLLWNHNETSASMFFCSAPAEPFDLIGKLYEAHERLFGEGRKLSDFWFADSGLLRKGDGKLAEGPRRVMEEYGRVIGDSLRFSLVPGHNPVGGYRVIWFDELYVICRTVEVREIGMEGQT